MLRGLQLSIPPRVLIRVSRPGASREGSIGGSGNAPLRTLHALGRPSFLLELLSWEGPSRQLPINLAAYTNSWTDVGTLPWSGAWEKERAALCPESEEESSAPLGLNFSTLFRRSLKTRIVLSRASRPDSRQGWSRREASNFLRRGFCGVLHKEITPGRKPREGRKCFQRSGRW